jgi:hypothetical protein
MMQGLWDRCEKVRQVCEIGKAVRRVPPPWTVPARGGSPGGTCGRAVDPHPTLSCKLLYSFATCCENVSILYKLAKVELM